MAATTPRREFTADGLRILGLGPLGPYANNAYAVIDTATGACAIIDAVPEPEAILDAIAAVPGATVSAVWFTHSHPDHIASFDTLRARLDVPFLMHPDEPWADHARIDTHLQGGETLTLGATAFTVIASPGHTPGGLCYYAAPFCLVGDTLFPGGPGHSTSRANLDTLIGSITTRLYALPDATTILPGHGEPTTIGASKEEYAAFAARPHPDDLHGDVLWAQG